jgi:hypothetical protein
VIRLADLDLNASRSGKESQAMVPVISKRGNAELRYGLYQATLIAWIMLKKKEENISPILFTKINGRGAYS